uniref:Knottins-like domain-containing protein n=1 Tax=Meloidogyne enterolobii TaxID=390850 RepID=A0A6V7V070_MELEN|nr:unnamed protein product [Meloidogyne enterolobii]
MKNESIKDFIIILIISSTFLLKIDEINADSLSGNFKGPCLSDTNCRNVCKGEGKRSGHCNTTFFGKCWCEN